MLPNIQLKVTQQQDALVVSVRNLVKNIATHQSICIHLTGLQTDKMGVKLHPFVPLRKPMSLERSTIQQSLTLEAPRKKFCQ